MFLLENLRLIMFFNLIPIKLLYIIKCDIVEIMRKNIIERKFKC